MEISATLANSKRKPDKKVRLEREIHWRAQAILIGLPTELSNDWELVILCHL